MSTKKLYWNTPRIQNVNVNNIYKIYNDFSKNVIGEDDKKLSELCLDICNKKTNKKYYGHIITLINLLGLLQYRKEENKYIVEKNEFLFENMDNIKFIEKYLDYSLAYFQYPRHNINEDRFLKIRKPYIVILILLKKLADRDIKEAYLTRNEFYYLFNKIDEPYKNYDDINDNLVDLILENNRAYGKNKNNVDMQWISYDMALFKNSSILTFDSSTYGDIDNFAFGLSNEYNVEVKLNWLLSDEVKNDIFEFDINQSATDKDVITEWAKFLNNEERFKKWETSISYSTDEEIESINPFNPDDISIDTKPVVLETILTRLKKGNLKLNPPFQREEVWNKRQNSRLIESLMLKIPLPTFYVSSDQDENWDVVDGRQRLTAIKGFILGNYDSKKEEYDKKGFKLQDLEFWNELNGKTYEELPGKLYNRIAETVFNFTIINPNTPEKVKRNIFKRINTGGLPLSSQEIRHALYQGASTELLEKLVVRKTFILAVDEVNDSRMKYREYILRFLSFYIRNYTHYPKNSNMENHISNTMRIINIIDNISFDKVKEEFKYDKDINLNDMYMSIKKVCTKRIAKDFFLAMNRAKEIFGTHTFRKSFSGKKRAPLNKTLFEVFGNLLIELNREEFQKLKENKEEFLLDYKENYLLKTEFSDLIGKNAQKISSVKKRYEELSKLIQKHTRNKNVYN